jgi:hypothetical protein
MSEHCSTPALRPLPPRPACRRGACALRVPPKPALVPAAARAPWWQPVCAEWDGWAARRLAF